MNLNKLDKEQSHYVKLHTGEITFIAFVVGSWMMIDGSKGHTNGYMYEIREENIKEILTKEKYPEYYL